jgi:adenosylcobinamide-phosphate synthase
MSLASSLAHTTELALLAAAIEAAVGWPAPLYAAIGHPVTWVGALIARLDAALNRESDGFARRRALGDRKSTRLNSSHNSESRMPSSA